VRVARVAHTNDTVSTTVNDAVTSTESLPHHALSTAGCIHRGAATPFIVRNLYNVRSGLHLLRRGTALTAVECRTNSERRIQLSAYDPMRPLNPRAMSCSLESARMHRLFLSSHFLPPIMSHLSHLAKPHARAAQPCAECDQEISSRVVNALGRQFHPRCFACSQCSKSITEEGHKSFAMRNGKVWCPKCQWHRQWSDAHLHARPLPDCATLLHAETECR
jgi:hypothetical protein